MGFLRHTSLCHNTRKNLFRRGNFFSLPAARPVRYFSGMFSLHGPVQSSREIFLPIRAPGVRQLADIFPLDARVHKEAELCGGPAYFCSIFSNFPESIPF